MSAARIRSVDALRGATVALMILVNNPGSWSYVYPVLRHASWHGLRPADLVFPVFLFIVGLSVVFSLQGAKASAAGRRAALPKILKRSLLLLMLGLLLNAFPHFDWANLRWPGVLQRIGLVFCTTAIAYLWLDFRGRAGLAAGILAGYWLLLASVPVPDTGHISLAMVDNLPAWLDRRWMAGHLWAQSVSWDPEGLLSTLPAVATGLLGTLAAELHSTTRPKLNLFGFGAVLLAAGLLWQGVFPFNKALWSSSYVLATAGIGSLAWLAAIDLFDGGNWPRFGLPLLVLGANPLFAYAGSEFCARLLYSIDWRGLSLSEHLFAGAQWLLPPYPASLAVATATVLFWTALCALLWRKGMRLKL